MNTSSQEAGENWEDLKVDKNSPIPAYYQIKEYIRELILSGRLAPHQRVPAERELCVICDVSRMTARQSLSELVKEGYLYREKGRGTFVAPPKITHPMMSLVSFSEGMHRRGMTAGGKTLRMERIREMRKDIKDMLCLEEDDTILMIERLRFANGVPVVLERSYFSYNRYGGLMDEDLSNESLYEILQRKFNTIPKRSRECIEAGLADGYLAEILKVGKGTPILMVNATSFEENGRPIEHVHSFYRGDRYKFFVELER